MFDIAVLLYETAFTSISSPAIILPLLSPPRLQKWLPGLVVISSSIYVYSLIVRDSSSSFEESLSRPLLLSVAIDDMPSEVNDLICIALLAPLDLPVIKSFISPLASASLVSLLSLIVTLRTSPLSTVTVGALSGTSSASRPAPPYHPRIFPP